MKRIACLLLTAVLAAGLCSAASAEELRGWNKKDGYQYVELGMFPYEKDGTERPVLFRVLGVEDGKALLFSEHVIDAHQPIYCDDSTVAIKKTYRRLTDYGDSDLHVYMNTEMLAELFDDDPLLAAVTWEEYGRLYPLTHTQLMREDYGFSKVYTDVEPKRKATPTPYCLAKPTPFESKPQADKTIGHRVHQDSNGCASYWVAHIKTPDYVFLQLCGYDGHMSYGTYVRTTVGIRAALSLDTGLIAISGGSGTKDDPFTLTYTGTEAPLPPTEEYINGPV